MCGPIAGERALCRKVSSNGLAGAMKGQGRQAVRHRNGRRPNSMQLDANGEGIRAAKVAARRGLQSDENRLGRSSCRWLSRHLKPSLGRTPRRRHLGSCAGGLQPLHVLEVRRGLSFGPPRLTSVGKSSALPARSPLREANARPPQIPRRRSPPCEKKPGNAFD